MKLKKNRTNLRLLVGALALPVVVACDSDFSVVPSSGTSSAETEVTNPVVEVNGDTTAAITEVNGDTTAITDGAVITDAAAECIDTPPIGDGWGWNGTASCRVGETTTVVDTQGMVATPDTSDTLAAECVDTAPVGDGWGWNGTESCRVDGSPVVTGTTNTQVNEAQATETFAPPSIDSITDLVLVTGQSNALGAGTSFDAFLDQPNQEVMAYTNEGWQVANLNQVWDLDWFPRTDPNTPPNNNFGLHFGKRVADRTSGRVVGFIVITSPGSGISDWGPNSDLFNSIRTRVSQAINELPFKSQLDAILWHQGESDGADRDEYSVALYDLISRFRSEPWFSDNRPFICGETASSPVNNQLNRLNTDADLWTSCIEAEGLPVLPGTDHFTASSLRTIGQRYADDYLRVWLGIAQ